MKSASFAALFLAGASLACLAGPAGERCATDASAQTPRASGAVRSAAAGGSTARQPERRRSVAEELYGRPASATL